VCYDQSNMLGAQSFKSCQVENLGIFPEYLLKGRWGGGRPKVGLQLLPKTKGGSGSTNMYLYYIVSMYIYSSSSSNNIVVIKKNLISLLKPLPLCLKQKSNAALK
jgi:hypothetical protein